MVNVYGHLLFTLSTTIIPDDEFTIMCTYVCMYVCMCVRVCLCVCACVRACVREFWEYNSLKFRTYERRVEIFVSDKLHQLEDT